MRDHQSQRSLRRPRPACGATTSSSCASAPAEVEVASQRRRRRRRSPSAAAHLTALLGLSLLSLSALIDTVAPTSNALLVSAFTPSFSSPPAVLAKQSPYPRQRTKLFQASTVIPPPPASHLSFPFFNSLQKGQQQQQQKACEYNDNNHHHHQQQSTYDRRKDEWARKYTSVDALREAFGSNRNRLWGDLDPGTARRLYKSLLPKALLELHHLGVHPEDLAPLAYRARVAAKLYARERCALPARVAANLYDGFRQWRKYGSFDTHGMSYQQLWEKYATLILLECQDEAAAVAAPDVSAVGGVDDDADVLTTKICLKILERSCATNEMVDRIVLSGPHENVRHKKAQEELKRFRATLEDDVRRLLEQPVEGEDEAVAAAAKAAGKSAQQLSAERVKLLKRVARFKKHLGSISSKTEQPQQQHQDDKKTFLLRQHAKEDEDHFFPWQDRKLKRQKGKRPWINRHHEHHERSSK